jgi:NAD(P)-dependent dehydrogenase (short-subunit alcohol dehydrogenase family)
VTGVQTCALPIFEAAEYGIQVNCVAPGGVVTERIKAMFTKAVEEASKDGRKMDLSAMAMPEEIAGTVLFLVSDDTNHIVGQTILVEGVRHL